MKIFIDGLVAARADIDHLLHWLSTFDDVELVFGFEYIRSGLTKSKVRNLIDTVQSVDAAIFVLVPYEGEGTRDVSDLEWMNILFECGMLLGTVSHNNICLITSMKGPTPPCLDILSIFHTDEKLFPSNLRLWIGHIQQKKTIITHPQTARLINMKRAISNIVERQAAFDRIRVFALSSYLGARTLIDLGIKIEKTTLLLREFTIVDEFLQPSMEDQINSSIELWKRMNKRGIINDLEIKRYDFHPTSEMYIFDDQFIILSNVYFDIKKGEYAIDSREVFYIDSSSESGKQFIKKCISHFDKLAEIYSDYTE